MAQHDYVISNGTGAAVRSDLNNALSAIVTQNSGSTEPTTTYAYQMWADTNAGVMKIRNGANSAWITLYQLDGEWTSIAFENGSAAAPSIYFKDSGTDTGFFSGGTDQVNIATAGTERVEWGTSEVVFNDAGNNYDFRVEGDTNANLLFVDASADAVGIGTGTPGSLLHLNVATAASDGTKGVRISNPAGTAAMFECGSSNDSYIGTLSGSDFSIRTNNTSRIYVTNGGNVGIGTESPSDTSVFGKALDVNGTTGAACYVRTNGSATNFGLIGHYGTDFYVTNNSNGPIRFFANADERARLTASGQWLVGTSSTLPQGEVIQGAGSSESLGLMRFRNDSAGPEVNLYKTRATSVAHSLVSSGDFLGSINFRGSDGSNYLVGARIDAIVDAASGTNDLPSRLVFSTTADGASSPTERLRIDNRGQAKFAYPTANDYGVFMDATNASFSGTVLGLDCGRAATDSYYFLNCSSGNEADNEFNLRGGGSGYCDGSWNGGGADYAEYFEWSDSNPDKEDRRGISVVLDGDKIREAVAGEDPIGVISGNPSMVGDTAWNKWSGKHLRDEFGTYLLDENGERQLNPAYDPDQEYIPREQRPEWDCVGLMGKLRIRKGQVTGSRWVKMRDISDSVEEWLVR